MLLVLLLVQHSQGKGKGCDMGNMRDIGHMHIMVRGIHIYLSHIQCIIQSSDKPHRSGVGLMAVTDDARPAVEQPRHCSPWP